MKNGKLIMAVALAAMLALVFTAMPDTSDRQGEDAALGAGVPPAGYTFTITKSGSTYSAASAEGITITPGTLAGVIGQIDSGRESAVKKLIFGTGGATVSLGTDTAALTSGRYIIEGKVTSASTDATIQLGYGAELFVAGTGTEITMTSSGHAIKNNHTGAVNVYGGAVSATTGAAIYNNAAGGVVNVFGGAVSATTGAAIWNNAAGCVVNVSGGVVSATTGRAIWNNAAGGVVNVSGGVVSAPAGTAIDNTSTGTVNVSGGTVSATTGAAIRNASTTAVNVSGGVVSTTTGRAIDNTSTGAVNVSGGTVSATEGQAIWNSAGVITISETSKSNPTRVTSANTSPTSGTIHIFNTSGSVVINGGKALNTAGGNIIYPSDAKVTATISNWSTLDAPEGDGTGGGTSLILIIGIIAIVALAGFALYWFVLRKKRSQER